jgi:hypothetical protein
MTNVPSDLEIAQVAHLLHIAEVAEALGVPVDSLIPYFVIRT